MADVTSPTAGRRYGVARVCQVWKVPRSSFYAAQQASAAEAGPEPSPARRGPKPAISDDDLLAAIRADLARSPWTGEGHRKVWARLRTLDGIRVARKRVLRLMREHSLLSPHRTRTRTVPRLHPRLPAPARSRPRRNRHPALLPRQLTLSAPDAADP